MSRGLFRKFSFWKVVGAYRSQWKRRLRRWFIPWYGKKGIGWWRNPKKAWYNFWYYRTSIRLPHTKLSRFTVMLAVTVVCVWNLITFPFDVAEQTMKNYQRQKARKSRASKNIQKKQQRSTASISSNPTRSTVEKSNSTRSSTTSASVSRTPQSTPKKTPTKKTAPRATAPNVKEQTQPPIFSNSYNFEQTKPMKPPVQKNTEPGENTPKSKPKHERDQYIRKRMIVAGSSYCDSDAIAKLTVGVYFDLVAEPENPYDKNAVALCCRGDKIGYIPRKETLPYVTGLKLGRVIYGVITDIKDEDGRKVFEFETWFASKG